MSSALRGTPTTAQITSAASITVNVPTGIQVGDVLVVQLLAKTTTANFWNTTSGWTNAASGNSAITSATVEFGTFYRIVDGTEGASYSFLVSSTGSGSGVTMTEAVASMTAFANTGLAFTRTFSANSGGSNVTNIVTTSADTTNSATGAMVLLPVFTYTNGAVNRAPSFTTPTAGGYAEDVEKIGTALSIALYRSDIAASTAVGSNTVVAGAATNYLGQNALLFNLAQLVSPTGLAATGTLGSFSISNGSNNSVNLTGLAGSGTLGAPKFEADYGATLDGTVQNLVRVGVTGLAGSGYPSGTITRSTYISAGVCEVVPYGMPAFQGNAFQNDAYQTEVMAFPTTLTGTAALGSVFYQASYSFLGWGTSYGSGAGMRGDLGTLAQYHVDYFPTGVVGTTSLGTILAGTLGGVTLTGLSCTGQVGSLTFHFDMNFTWPTVPRFGIIYPTGRVGVVSLRFDSIFGVLGLHGSAALGSIVLKNSYAVTGVQGAGQVGSVAYRMSVGVTGFQCVLTLGGFVAGWVQNVPVLGVLGSTALNPPIVKNHQTFNGLSVAGSGGVGQVGFQISSSAPVGGVVGIGQLGAVHIAVDGSVSVVGLAATGQLGHVTPLGMPRLDTHGTAGLGAVGIRVDCAVNILGIGAVGNVGQPGEKRDGSTHVAGVQATGYIGSVAPAHLSAHDKRSDIFVRTQ